MTGRGGKLGSPGAGDDVLHTLHFGKGFGELGLRVAEAVDARAKEEVGCCVQRVSVFGVAYISPCPLDIVLWPPPEKTDLKNSADTSTSCPLPPIKPNSTLTCFSKIARSLTRSLINCGRINDRLACHCSPSVVKMLSPRKSFQSSWNG